jgi:putative protease
MVKKKKKTLKTKVRAKAKVVKKPKTTRKVATPPKEKVLGRVEHYFDKISVAAVAVKASFKVGAVIHVKGHTTDFYQRIESMQIEHQKVAKVEKGDDVGIKVKELVRKHDQLCLADEKALATHLANRAIAQTPLFKTAAASGASRTAGKADPYSNTKFLKF